MSLASSQSTSRFPRVCSPAALAHPFAPSRSILLGQARPAANSPFANPLRLPSTDHDPRLDAAQRALTAPRSVRRGLLFL